MRRPVTTETSPHPARTLDELDAEIMRIAGLSNAIEYQFIKLLAEFDELDGWVG